MVLTALVTRVAFHLDAIHLFGMTLFSFHLLFGKGALTAARVPVTLVRRFHTSPELPDEVNERIAHTRNETSEDDKVQHFYKSESILSVFHVTPC